jgi:hypothetical protein
MRRRTQSRPKKHGHPRLIAVDRLVRLSSPLRSRQSQKQAYLGTDKEFTVPIAELVGLALALEITKEATDQQFDVFVDKNDEIVSYLLECFLL